VNILESRALLHVVIDVAVKCTVPAPVGVLLIFSCVAVKDVENRVLDGIGVESID
jgi:hypothetical protein